MPRLPVVAVLVLVAAAFAGALALRPSPSSSDPGGGWTDRTVEVDEHVSLALRIPDGPAPHPVLVHVPGGGWTDIDERPVGAAFGHDEAVAAGWALATVRYRTADDEDAGAVRTTEQVDDVTAALRWLRGPGAALGLDDTTVAMGHSAGAHLLALAVARADSSLQPDSVVLAAGVYDFADDVRGSPLLLPGLRDAVGCVGADCSVRARLEPARWADPQDPPVAIVHGTDDRVAPVAGAYRYATALRRAGVPTTVRIVEGGHHRDQRVDATVRAVLGQALRQATDERSSR